MRCAFCDSFFFIALLSPADAAHGRARSFVAGYRERMLTTSWVLTELADALSGVGSRAATASFIERLPTWDALQIVTAEDSLFQAGLSLYKSRPDKEWSLTDYISFVVMRREGISEALTGDHHFEQAGFIALLK